MTSFQLVTLVFGFFLLPSVRVLGHSCHREDQFIKVQQSGLPLINVMKEVTTSKRFFCSKECLSHKACNSFAYLTTATTGNCQLSTSVDGVSVGSGVVAEIYKKVPTEPKGCEPNPCQHGGTCVETCYEPFYICRCPASAEGKICEWDLSCFLADWGVSFDTSGWSYCDRYTTNYLTGLKRSSCHGLNCIENAKCCPVRQEFSQDSQTCVNGDWYSSFGTEAWNMCPDGHFITGLYTSAGDQTIYQLEYANCCKPNTAPSTYSDCYDEDIGSSFDVPDAEVSCSRSQYYVVGMFTNACTPITCIETFRCCKMG